MNEIINTFVDDLFSYPYKKVFHWATNVITYGTGIEQRNALLSRPIREWNVKYKILTVGMRDQILELYNRSQGQFNTFLFSDPQEYQVVAAECSFTAIAAQVLFQLFATYHLGETEQWTEDKEDIVPGGTYQPIIYVDGVLKTEGVHYTINDTTGILDLTLMGAPGAGIVVTADYQYYFRVRFVEDSFSMSEIDKSVWSVNDFGMVQVLS